jgi:hypothetical protein
MNGSAENGNFLIVAITVVFRRTEWRSATADPLERFHLRWKRSSRCFASNFISLRSQRDSRQVILR